MYLLEHEHPSSSLLDVNVRGMYLGGESRTTEGSAVVDPSAILGLQSGPLVLLSKPTECARDGRRAGLEGIMGTPEGLSYQHLQGIRRVGIPYETMTGCENCHFADPGQARLLDLQCLPLNLPSEHARQAPRGSHGPTAILSGGKSMTYS